MFLCTYGYPLHEWYIFLNSLFFCSVPSQVPFLAWLLKVLKWAMVVNVEIFVLAVPDKEHFTNILDCFSKRPIHKLCKSIHFRLTDHNIEMYLAKIQGLETFKSSVFLLLLLFCCLFKSLTFSKHRLWEKLEKRERSYGRKYGLSSLLHSQIWTKRIAKGEMPQNLPFSRCSVILSFLNTSALSYQ